MRISLEGNIGAGKSALLQRLGHIFGEKLRVFPEPLQEWGDLLKLYYEDKKSWSLPLSLKILLGFTASNESDSPHTLVERSPMACKHVFTKLLHQEGTMNSYQWNVFCDYYDVIGWTPDLVIYLDVPESVCLERIKHRQREGEDGIELHELRLIQYHYEQLLSGKQLEFPGEVIRVDGTGPFETVLARIEAILKKILV